VAFKALVTLRCKVSSIAPVLYQAMKSERIINQYRVSLHLNVTDVEYTNFFFDFNSYVSLSLVMSWIAAELFRLSSLPLAAPMGPWYPRF
jgi:hypothetical protein